MLAFRNRIEVMIKIFENITEKKKSQSRAYAKESTLTINLRKIALQIYHIYTLSQNIFTAQFFLKYLIFI